MIKILFVCHGNICRSPMAEYYFKKLVADKKQTQKYHIESAATSYEEIGSDIYAPAKQELYKHGIPFSKHAARHITKEDYHHFDYLVCMDKENLGSMLRYLGGDPDGKIHMLLDYTEHPRDVADPWYTRNFEATWQDIEHGCQALLQHIENDEGGII